MDSPKIDATYGCALIGLVCGAILYGVTLLQTRFFYYKQYPKDTFLTKFLVFFVWVLDTTHIVLSTISVYWYLVTNYANPAALGKTTWSLNTDCNGLIGLIVQVFFARRVWIMSRNIYLTITILVLACLHFGLGIVFTVESFILKDTAKYGKLIWVTCLGLGSAAAADIVVAVALCYYLLKSRTGFSRTDSLIATLTAYSLTTGLVTSIFATICVITFAIMPTNYVWLVFFWILGKSYVNSLLAALNSRESLREKAGVTRDRTFLHLSEIRNVSVSNPPEGSVTDDPKPRSRNSRHGGLTVAVHTQTITKTDFEVVDATMMPVTIPGPPRPKYEV